MIVTEHAVGGPFTTYAVTVKVVVPAAVGVPVMRPELGFRSRPAGRLPAVTA